MDISSLFKYLETKASPIFIIIVLLWGVIVFLFLPVLYKYHPRIISKKWAAWFIGTSGLIIFVFAIKYIICGYSKDFLVLVVDEFNNPVYNYSLSLNGKDIKVDQSNPIITINSKQLYAAIRVDHKSLNRSIFIKNDDFVDKNTIHIKLNGHLKNYPCTNRNKEVKIAYPLYVIAESGGIDLFTPASSLYNYVYFNRPDQFKKNNFEVAVNSIFYNNESSLSLEIGGALMVLVGEGTMKHVSVKVNYTGKADGWKEIKKYELEQAIKANEPIRLSASICATSDNSFKLCTTIYHCDNVDEKMENTEIRNVMLNQDRIKVGCFIATKKKTPYLRLLNISLVDSKS